MDFFFNFATVTERMEDCLPRRLKISKLVFVNLIIFTIPLS